MARIIHSAWTQVSASLAALPSDTALTSGRATAVVNSSGGALDYQWSGKLAIATCAGNRKVEIWAYSVVGASAFPASTSGGGLVDVSGMKDTLRLVDIIPVTTTASAVYGFGPYSMAKVFDGFPPRRHGLAFFQNTGDPFEGTDANSVVGYNTVEVTAT
jgi:hypothetical protein